MLLIRTENKDWNNNKNSSSSSSKNDSPSPLAAAASASCVSVVIAVWCVRPIIKKNLVSGARNRSKFVPLSNAAAIYRLQLFGLPSFFTHTPSTNTYY